MLWFLNILHWTPSSMPISFLYWEAQDWTQHSKCSLISAEEKDDHLKTAGSALAHAAQNNISFFFAARAHFWLTFNLVLTRSFSDKVLSSWAAPNICWCLGLVLSRGRTLCFPLVNYIPTPRKYEWRTWSLLCCFEFLYSHLDHTLKFNKSYFQHENLTVAFQLNGTEK